MNPTRTRPIVQAGNKVEPFYGVFRADNTTVWLVQILLPGLAVAAKAKMEHTR